MSEEILKALGELKAGQDSLRSELTGAISQSNEAVIGALEALGTEVHTLKAGQVSLHAKVDALQAGQDGLVTAIRESNETVLATAEGIGSGVKELSKVVVEGFELLSSQKGLRAVR